MAEKLATVREFTDIETTLVSVFVSTTILYCWILFSIDSYGKDKSDKDSSHKSSGNYSYLVSDRFIVTLVTILRCHYHVDIVG